MLSIGNLNDIAFIETFLLIAKPLNEKSPSDRFVTFELPRESIEHQKFQGNLGHFWTGVSLLYDEGTLAKSLDIDLVGPSTGFAPAKNLISVSCEQTAKVKEKYGSLGVFPLVPDSAEVKGGEDKIGPRILFSEDAGHVSLAPFRAGFDDCVRYVITDVLGKPILVRQSFNHHGCVLRVTLVQTRSDPVNRS